MIQSVLDDTMVTCLNINCPERLGGQCNAMANIDSEETLVQLFLSESNYIEGVHDSKSLDQAIKAWKYLINKPVLNGEVIQKTHRILMKYQDLALNEKGYWRQRPVWIGSAEATHYQLIPGLVAVWLESIKALISFSKSRQYQSVENNKTEILADRIKSMHVTYEKIHPFIDGNGRTVRMFLNWQRLKVGLPLLIIFDADKQGYYQWFKEYGR